MWRPNTVLSLESSPEFVLVYYTLHLELSVTVKSSCPFPMCKNKTDLKLLSLSLVLVQRIV